MRLDEITDPTLRQQVQAALSEDPDASPRLVVELGEKIHPFVKERVGRLYRLPTTDLSSIDLDNLAHVMQAIEVGYIFPSVTNVMGVKGEPGVLRWTARSVAEEAIAVEAKHPGLINSKPDAALRYLKAAPDRLLTEAQQRGSRVHKAVELLSYGLSRSEIPFALTPEENRMVDSWLVWANKYQPEFLHREATVFGETLTGLKYGGTFDFSAKLNTGETTMGDYKCVTPDTLILMADRTLKRADEVALGDEVVAYSSSNHSLTTAPISYVGDNGVHDIIRLITKNGRFLDMTYNHPVLTADRKSRVGWVQAQDLQPGTHKVFAASGWSLSPGTNASHKPWPFDTRYLSPYHFGVLWTLAQAAPTPWKLGDGSKDSKSLEDSFFTLPDHDTRELRFELSKLGFPAAKLSDEEEKGEENPRRKQRISIRHGIEKMARKMKWTPQETLDLLNDPRSLLRIFSVAPLSLEGFYTGVREVARIRETRQSTFMNVRLRIPRAGQLLQQLYANDGVSAKLGVLAQGGGVVLRVNLEQDEVKTYGLLPEEISQVLRLSQPKRTVAIEVEGAHTHVTSGIISHNTNQSGLHNTVALQLAANRTAELLSPDNVTVIATPEVDFASALLLRPEGYQFPEVDTSDEVLAAFYGLRDAWNFHAFDGQTEPGRDVFLPERV